MRFHHWIQKWAVTSLGLALLGASPSFTLAQDASKLPKECIAAALATTADCDALLKTLKKSTRKQLPNSPAATAPVAIPDKTKAPLANDCLAVGLTTQADCDALHANTKAQAKSGAATKAKAPAPAVNKPSQPAPVVPSATSPAAPIAMALPKDCVSAGLATQADCDAFHKRKAAGRKSNTPAQSKPAKTSTLSKVPPIGSQPRTPAAPLSQAPNALKNQKPAPTGASVAAAPPAVPLAVDCIAAGLKSIADCDAMHLAADKGAKVGPSGAAVTPASPSEVVSVLPKGITQAQVAPLLDSAKQSKTRGTTPAPAAVVISSPPPPPASDTAAQAGIAAPPATTPVAGKPFQPNSAAPAIQLPANAKVIAVTAGATALLGAKPSAPTAKTAPNTPPQNPIGLSIGVVLQIGSNPLIIDSSGRDQARIANRAQDRTAYEQLPQQRYRETITRPDGTRIITVYDHDGDILRRSRFDRDGREVVLAEFDDPRAGDLRQWRDPGDDLPPLQLREPVDQYVLDADQSDAGRIELFFRQPPVEAIKRLYSISEVERSARLRDILPRVEIGNLTFETGSAQLGIDQIAALGNVAKAMLALLRKNPAETFLIEGHTDAVGTAASNLVLSDDRAAAVAQLLTDAYHVPPENLATQGYGSNFLKVQTTGPEHLNRRVVVRRITPLIRVGT